jgi:hypothetical protein
MTPAAVNADADTYSDSRVGVRGVAISIAVIGICGGRICVPVGVWIVSVWVAVPITVIGVPEADAPSAIAIPAAEAVAAVPATIATVTAITTAVTAAVNSATAESAASAAHRSRTTTAASAVTTTGTAGEA